MIEFNNKIIIMFFVGVVIVLGLGYVMNSNGMFSGYATSSCSDTDGGKNYYLYGIVIKGTTTRVDSCLNATRLREFYCNNAGKIASVNYVCTLPYMCAGGQCIATTTTTTFTSSTTTPSLPQSCIDSDENNIYIGGYVYFDPHNITTGTYYDYCYSNNQYVQEYVCGIGLNGGYYISGGGYYCPRGCQDGACVDFSCTDSDVTPEFPDGRNWYLVGTVTDNREDPPTNEDYCYYNDYDYYSYQLFEHYCEADGYSSVLHTCPNSCQDGACFTCEDSDGGLNPYVYGEVNEDPNWPPWQDVCEDENTLMEATCGGSGQGPANFSRIPCYRGCQDGACIGIPPVCLDTDGGIRKYSFGNTTGRAEENSENVISEIDYCINFVTNESLLSCGSSFDYPECGVREFFCDSSTQTEQTWVEDAGNFRCPDGCDQGKCLCNHADSFDRSNGALGPRWQVLEGSWRILNNGAQDINANGNGLAVWYNTALNEDYSVEADYIELPNQQVDDMGVALRVIDKNNYYAILWNHGGFVVRLIKRVNGIDSFLGSWIPSTRPGHIKLEVQGNNLIVYAGGVELGRATDNSLTQKGRAGIISRAVYGQQEGAILDNWQMSSCSS